MAINIGPNFIESIYSCCCVFFSCIWKFIRITNEDDELTVNIFDENVADSEIAPTTLKTTTISANELDEKVSVTESYLHFDEKISEKSVTVSNENASVNELSDEIVVEKINTSPKPTTLETTTISANELDEKVSVTESYLHFVEKVMTVPYQNATVNKLSDENVVEKINASPKPQDENDNETQGADPFKLIVIVSSIILFAVVTIIIGLFIFCLRGEKKEDVMEMKKIESGEISDTFMD